MQTDKWLRRYRLALRFASFYNSDFRYDIVHQAWLNYQDKEKEDLFEIDLKDENSFLYTVIKRSFFHWNYKERKGDTYRYFGTDELQSKFDNQEDELIGKDLYTLFYQKLVIAFNQGENINLGLSSSQVNEIRSKYKPRKYSANKLSKEYGISETTIYDILKNKDWGNNKGEHPALEIFRLKSDGYSQKEIAKELKISRQTVGEYSKKIEEMSHINNPFNGSKTIIKKQLSERVWEEREDKEDFDLEDLNEYCALYIHKESKEGWLVKIKNPKGSEFYIKRLEDSKN